MRAAKIAYPLVVLLVGYALPAIGYYFFEQLGFDTGFLVHVLFLLVLAMLTFPLGSLGMIFSTFLVLTGITTPLETKIVAPPILAVLGYMQWFWLLPKLYRSKA